MRSVDFKDEFYDRDPLSSNNDLYGVGCSSCEDIPKESYYPGMTCKECNQPFRIVKNKQ
jgi:hypothetical protein